VFAGGRVTGSTGCNSLGGEAAINGSSIRFGQLTTTRRACRDDLAPVEAAMLAVLRGDVPFELESGQLRLNPDGERGLVLRG
jgi:heat shock protein HslJ